MQPRVMVVDDEEDVVESVTLVLESTIDAEVTRAMSGQEALAILRAMDPPSVIVSDYKMPDMNGIEFLEKARELCPMSRFVLMTAFPDLHVAVGAMNRARVDHFFIKPFEGLEFAKIVKRLSDEKGIP